MKTLLLGSNGQLGWELQRALAPLGTVIALPRGGAQGLCGDITRPEELSVTVRKIAPDVIINAAAYTAVDQAESEPEQAEAVNATAPAVLADEVRALGAWLVHYSTDYVFDGSGSRPWRESDRTDPLNVYGRTKRQGELPILESSCQSLVFRTSWVYAARGRNFIWTMLRLASERDLLQVIDDQHGAPTGAALIADVTAQARHVEWLVKVPVEAIARVSTDAFPAKAHRPGNSRLDCSRLEQSFGLRMPSWQAGVDHALAEILACKGTA